MKRWAMNGEIGSDRGICSNSDSLLNMDSNNTALNEVYLRIPVGANQKI